MRLKLFIASAMVALYGAGTSAGAAIKPNLLYIMADDLNADWKNDRLSYMPNLKKRFKDGGTFFENHVAAVPVCGPSRSSFLLGRYPHNGGYKMNGDIQSIHNYVSQHNHTLGRWLTDAGYYTAFLGKYVNSCEGNVPHGWNHWGAFLNTYDFYNASAHFMDWESTSSPDPPVVVKSMTHVHQADFLGNFTLEQARKAKAVNKPFFISVTPVMPHWGTCYGPGIPDSAYASTDPHFEFKLIDPKTGIAYAMPTSPCPSDRHKHSFDGQTNPHIEGVWNVTILGPRPAFMRTAYEKPGALNEFQAEREDIGWRNRSGALLDLDDMIGDIMDGLESMDLLENTIAVFTSDNGYHLGEHKMPFGKGEPYDTDVSLPMYISGPGIPKGVIFPHPTNHLDITATFVEFANAQSFVPTLLDGKSFASEFADNGKGANADTWRQYSFSEFFANTNTWRLIRVVNSTHKFSVVRWCTNDTEVFDMIADKWQTKNLAGQPGFAATAESIFLPITAALGHCDGTNCSTQLDSLTQMAPSLPIDFMCYPIIQESTIGSFSFVVDHGKVVGMRGWALDLDLTSIKPGWDPVDVRIILDINKPMSKRIPDLIANVSRPDIVSVPGVPNPNHGFEITFPKGFLPAAGRHSITLRIVDPGTNMPKQIGKTGLNKCFKDLVPISGTC